MNWAEEHYFVYLWLIFPLGMFLFLSIVRRKKVMARFVEPHLVEKLTASFSRSKLIIKAVLIILIFVFSILALSRPQWGFQWREVKRQGLDILVVIDVSKSMLTQDVKPNRLERTKLAVMDLLKKLQGDRIGLVAFAGEAFLVCPLTVDYNGFMLSLSDINVDTIPRGGTDLEKAIAESLRGYEETPSQYKAIIIVTDGDNLEGDPLALAKQAKEKGIKIYCIGIGTQDGELIPVRNARGGKEFVKDEKGNYVKSRLNESLLQQVALTTGGIYVRSSGAQFGLDLIYERDLSKLEKREIEASMEKKYFERFQFPLGLATLFLILETCICTRRKEKKSSS